MRVISGKYKGRVIKGYDIEGTRPTMDRVKESVMASIQDYIEDSVVLDLFAGSGNLGLEAISNGAKKCYFVDCNRECVKVIWENVRNFGIEKQVVVLEKDYRKALEELRDQGVVFDLIFVDPPYRDRILMDILEYVESYELLSSGGIIVLEYREDDLKEEVDGYKFWKKKKYGDKFVSIYQKVEKK